MDDIRLGTILLETGVIAESDLDRCLQIQTLTEGARPLGQILVEQGLIERAALNRLLALQDARRRERQPAGMPDDEVCFLRAAVALGATELVVSEGRPPAVRVAGEWRNLSEQPLAGPEVWEFVRDFMGPEVLEDLADRQYVCRDFHEPVVCRGRITAFRQFDGVAVVVRLHPENVRLPAAVGVPQQVVDLVRSDRGFVLLVGEGGSGLTEAFGALLHEVARDPARYVVVLDDNLEYPLPEQGGLVIRRRVGEHVIDYPTAVRTAVHEDPDVLFIGDVGQPETFDRALRAAESGRLVVGCLRASSIVGALSRVFDFYGSHDLPRVRATMASVLRCVVAKCLIPDGDYKGLLPATEMLLVDDPVRQVLRGGDLDQIDLLLRIEDSKCGHSLDRSLLKLLQAGKVTFEEVFTRAREKAWILERMQTTTSE